MNGYTLSAYKLDLNLHFLSRNWSHEHHFVWYFPATPAAFVASALEHACKQETLDARAVSVPVETKFILGRKM